MSRMLKVARIVLLGLLGLVVVVVGAGLGYRAHVQRRNEQATAIRTPNGVDEGMYVKIGGIDQWVQIRGQDRDNPVILCLNGGPGASWVPLTLWFVPWEKSFTVAQWDQRGEGKTLETTGLSIASTMSIPVMVHDGIEVAEFLCRLLQKNKILLLGHSWGSILGIQMVRQRPDLFSAYVGTGQVSNLSRSLELAYDQTLRKARTAGDRQAIEDLEQIGPPPYAESDFRRIPVLFKWLGAYAPQSDRAAFSALGPLLLTAPHYSLRDIYYRNQGFTAVPTSRLYHAMLSTDLANLGPDFKIPVYFFQGTEDDITLASLARDYFDTIKAPHKEFVAFDGGGHFVVWSMREKFLKELVTRVRPLATSP